MLTWRKVVLPHEPRHGDMLIYPNTAGYQMDKNESQFHDLPLPRRLC
ncbi:diaminopimelate decarboxylase domain protein [Mycobacterium xenopi 4042]|uniref:Diaminopimelate decarboxylase domain protein n=1 Tax=Mycobacterium xenopi 4042 TaxID=1299334 RepID=X8A7J3_MYCXE|nr:diaminopimelate decarboxylase domain protein [Mycobacterium xenopi 4042]